MTNIYDPTTGDRLRLEIQTARNDVFVWGISTWTGYKRGGENVDESEQWINILGPTHEINIKRGAKRNGVSLTLEAGTLTATVYGSDIDPRNNPYVKPGTAIRLVAETPLLGDTSVFTGVVYNLNVVPSKEPGKTNVTVSAVDRVKDLGNLNRSGAVEGTYSERVASLLDKHAIPYETHGGDSTLLAQNAYDSTVLNHLTLATTSEVGHFFVDKDNWVQAYGSDATPTRAELRLTDQPIPQMDDITNAIQSPSFEYDGGSWTFDTKQTASSTNLITNPNFTLGTAGWLPLGSTWKIALSNAQAYQGTTSMAVSVARNNPSSQSMAVTSDSFIGASANATYTVRCMVWLPSYFTNNNVYVGLQTFNSSNQYMGIVGASTIDHVTGQWYEVKALVTTPANTRWIQPYLVIDNGALTSNIPTGLEAYVDCFSIRFGNSMSEAYFDGDTAPDAPYSNVKNWYSWTGTPGASFSVKTTQLSEPPRVTSDLFHGAGTTSLLLSGDSTASATSDWDNHVEASASGTQYTLSYWAYATPLPAAYAGYTKSVTVNMQFEDAGGQPAGSRTFTITPANNRWPTEGQWVRVKNTFTTPSWAINVTLKVTSTLNDGTRDHWDLGFYMDELMLTKGPNLYDYFDGDSGGFWTGGTGSSASISGTSRYENYLKDGLVIRYDTSSMVNDIYINNLTWALNDNNEPLSVNTKYGPFQNPTSIATYGAFSGEVDTNLDPSYVDNFAEDLLGKFDHPETRVETVQWNATNSITNAANLDVYDKVNVVYTDEYSNIDSNYYVLAIEHNISASNDGHRWIVTADLLNEGIIN